jgi:hypothetical protein
MLGQIGISHTAVLDQATYEGMVHELNGQPTATFGLLLEEMEPGRLFVRAMYEGGPAQLAGLALGDEIVAVAGDPALESPRTGDAGYDPRPDATRLFALRPAAGARSLELLVRSDPRKKPRARRPRAAGDLRPRVGPPRPAHRRARRPAHRHRPLWMVARGSGDYIQDAVRRFADCDALVVDLRAAAASPTRSTRSSPRSAPPTAAASSARCARGRSRSSSSSTIARAARRSS